MHENKGMLARDLVEAVPAFPPDTPLEAFISDVTDGPYRMVAITDQGRLVGVITRSDVIAVMRRALSAVKKV